MRNRTTAWVTALALLVGLMAIPLTAGATGEGIPRVGERLWLLEIGDSVPPETFAANEPFHVVHGFGVGGADPTISEISQYRFELWVDGIRRGGGKTMILDGLEWVQIGWVINFRGGLPAGPHEFRVVWTSPDEPTLDQTHVVVFVE